MNNQLSQLQRTHVRSKSSVYSLHQFSSVNVPVAASQIDIANSMAEVPHEVAPHTTPKIREQYYGQAFGARNRAQMESWIDYPLGSADLIHWGRYFGASSSIYLDHDFIDESLQRAVSPDDDGYVGYYHYANGINFFNETDIEDYLLPIVGIKREGDNYSGGNGSKRETMITFCAYNIFNRSDFRVKLVVHHKDTNSVKVDKSYSIVPNVPGKTLSFTPKTIKTGISAAYWEELFVSEVLRLFAQTDQPQKQLVGLVNYNDIFANQESLLIVVKLLVKYLPKGAMTEPHLRSNGISSTTNRGGYNKTSQYRNQLINTLIRVCQLDNTNEAVDLAVSEIRKLDEYCWNYIILQLWKSQTHKNREQEYILLLHQIATSEHLYSPTHYSLVLLEQVKFLISKTQYLKAIAIAERCVKTLPLDFDVWFYLSLSYLLVGKYSHAFEVFNNLPVLLNRRNSNNDPNIIDGIPDFYSRTFVNNLKNDLVISEKTFNEYFPKPDNDNDASITKIWNNLLAFDSYKRHPFTGYQFYHSPLVNASTKELSVVDPLLIKSCGPKSSKTSIASISSGVPLASMLNLEKTSTWGRAYDLLTLFAALKGWDGLVALKESYGCEEWVEQLFVIVFQDLKSLMTVTDPSKNPHHSALEWSIIGLLGWQVKYNIKEAICALITSAKATSFDYFAVTRLLDIYDEMVLTEASDGRIDILHDPYQDELFSKRLLLDKFDTKFKQRFIKDLEDNLLPLDFIILQLMKLVSWNMRWYQYMPNYKVTRIIQRLCNKHDPIFIRGQFRAVFEGHKELKKSHKKSTFSFWNANKRDKKLPNDGVEFSSEDHIIDYMEKMVDNLYVY